MSFMWRKKPTPAPEAAAPAPSPVPPAPAKSKPNRSGWRRGGQLALTRAGWLDVLTNELLELIRGKANNVYLTELWRIRDQDIKLLTHDRHMRVSIALGEQRAKNDAAKRKYCGGRG